MTRDTDATPACETCIFMSVRWRKGDQYEYYSQQSYAKIKSERAASSFECRRHAPRGPVIWPSDTYDSSAFPLTSDGDWCGEYAPKAAS